MQEPEAIRIEMNFPFMLLKVMVIIQAWLLRNTMVVQFIYGLSFFSLGLVVAVQNRTGSRYRLANRQWALAGFAFVHAAADWGLLFIPLQSGPDQSITVAALWGLRTVLGAISFGFLLHFGLGLLRPEESRVATRVVHFLAPAVTVLWLIAFFGYPVLHDNIGVSTWYWHSEVWSRYMLGLPSALVVAYGLMNQADQLRRDHLHAHVRNLHVSAGFFALYGLTAGLVVPRQMFWPASVLNNEAFLRLVGIPIELVRTVVAVGTAVATARLMGVFSVETTRRLYHSEQERAILRERERIARELHDGILQTLYGVGLGLKTLGRRLPAEDEAAGSILADLTAQLSGAIWDLRHAVTGLHENQLPLRSVTAVVDDYVRQCSRLTGLAIACTVQGFEGVQADLILSGDYRREILALLREGLSNTVRHAGANQATVLLALEEDTILLRLTDDGVGFASAAQMDGSSDAGGTHNGLRNMRQRTEQLGGIFRVESAPGKGTRLLFQIPVPELASTQQLTGEAANR